MADHFGGPIQQGERGHNLALFARDPLGDQQRKESGAQLAGILPTHCHRSCTLCESIEDPASVVWNRLDEVTDVLVRLNSTQEAMDFTVSH